MKRALFRLVLLALSAALLNAACQTRSENQQKEASEPTATPTFPDILSGTPAPPPRQP
jgi:hypothetical protein